MSYKDNVRAPAGALDINAELEAVVAEFEVVERGERANWNIAERTYRCTLDAGDIATGRALGKISMDEWCRLIRERTGRPFARTTGIKYKAHWTKYGDRPADQRPSWGEADAEYQGGTVGERMVEADFNRAMINASPEQKRHAFASLAREPEVLADLPTSAEVFSQIVRDNPAAVQEAWKDTETNVGLSTARWEARDEQLEPIRRAQSESKEVFQPDDSALEHTHFLYGVQSRVEQWAHELREVEAFLGRVNDVNMMTRRSTRRSLELLIDAASRCRDALPHSYDEPDTEPEAAVRAAQEALRVRK